MGKKKMIVWLTHCCQSKVPIEKGTPRELYMDTPGQYRLSTFWKIRDQLGSFAKAGILSYKYGLIWEDEVFENYDLSAKDVNGSQRRLLGKLIAGKISGRKRILYYAKHPLTCVPFVQMLVYAGKSFSVIFSQQDLLQFLPEEISQK